VAELLVKSPSLLQIPEKKLSLLLRINRLNGKQIMDDNNAAKITIICEANVTRSRTQGMEGLFPQTLTSSNAPTLEGQEIQLWNRFSNIIKFVQKTHSNKLPRDSRPKLYSTVA
jgi:hypothetical protein